MVETQLEDDVRSKRPEYEERLNRLEAKIVAIHDTITRRNQEEIDRQSVYRPPMEVIKENFPEFYGEYVDDWIYDADRFFWINNVFEEDKMHFAITHLRNKAQRWLREYCVSRIPSKAMTWSELKQLLRHEFGSRIINDHRNERRYEKQESIAECCRQITDLIESWQVTEKLLKKKREIEQLQRKLKFGELLKADKQDNIVEDVEQVTPSLLTYSAPNKGEISLDDGCSKMEDEPLFDNLCYKEEVEVSHENETKHDNLGFEVEIDDNSSLLAIHLRSPKLEPKEEMSLVVGERKRVQSTDAENDDYYRVDSIGADSEEIVEDFLELGDRMLTFDPISQAYLAPSPNSGQFLWFEEPPDVGYHIQNGLWCLMSRIVDIRFLWFEEPPDTPRKQFGQFQGTTRCWISYPYEIVYGQRPPIHYPYLAGDSRVEAVDRTLLAREDAIKLLRFHLQRAQNRMVQQANKKRLDCEFQVGDWVLVKLQPYRQSSIRGKTHKLSPRFYGPFCILARVGKVAYKIEIPTSARMHNVIHVSQLKKVVGNMPNPSRVTNLQREAPRVPKAVLDERVAWKDGASIGQYLIRWSNALEEDDTWEDESFLAQEFPDFVHTWSTQAEVFSLARGRARVEGEATDTMGN